MVIKRLLIWVFLIISVYFYMSGVDFSTIRVRGEPDLPVPGFAEEAENGMGGTANPESLYQPDYILDFDILFNPELMGVPEPESFSAPQILTYRSYTLESGDMIGFIARNTGLNEDTLVSVNNIINTRTIRAGNPIRIPNQDGILYTVRAGDTLERIAEQHGTTSEKIYTTNELFSENLTAGLSLFIPGGRMDWVRRQEINGDLFLWPIASRNITSPYGWRLDPFGSGQRQFHTGIDIGASVGTPVIAAMPGQVARVAFDNVLGHHIIISHHSGYRTLYAHLNNVPPVRTGAYVQTGQRIGNVGVSGRVTGPHLHFTVYKNGVTVNPLTLMRR